MRHDSHRRREVEAAGGIEHRDRQPVGVLLAQRLRLPVTFFPNTSTARPWGCIPERAVAGAEVEQRSVRFAERGPIAMHPEIHRIPVVHAGALHFGLGEGEAQGFNEVERCSSHRAETRDVPRVRWDLWLDQCDMKRHRP
jgi:hypothetical protein